MACDIKATFHTLYKCIIHTCFLMRDEEERSKQGQTNNKAKEHSTLKAVTFPKKNELLQKNELPRCMYEKG